MSHWPLGRKYAWFVVLMLTAAYAVAFIDRYFIASVIEVVKADLQLSDLMVGLLLGPAFAVFYLLLGIPCGWLADRVNRPLLIVIGMVLWSLATAASGLAGSFATLLIFRLTVGVGEAALSPCALSLIADYVPAHTRARAIGTYVSGAILGAGLAYLLGGQITDLMSVRPSIGWPVFDERKPWQAGFVLIGVLSLIIVLPILIIREPRKVLDRQLERRPSGPTMKQALSMMGNHWKAFGGVLLGVSSLVIVGNTNMWTVALFQRTWGWSATQIGVANGLLILLTAIPGAALSGWISDRITLRGRHDGPVVAMLWGAVATAPAFVLYPLMPTPELAIALLTVGMFGQVMISAAGPAAVIQISGAEVRGQAAAWYYAIVSLTGHLIGTTSVGAISDALGGAEMLRYSSSLVALIFSVTAFVLIFSMRGAYRAAARANRA